MSATNGNYASWAPPTMNGDLPVATGVDVAVGDLLYFDAVAKGPKPVSQIADQGSALATQALAAQYFLGVSNYRQLANDLSPQAAQHQARIIVDYVWEYPCVSSTFELGDFLAPNYTAGAAPLADQLLVKTTSIQAAVARVVKRYPTATTRVKVRITSRLLDGFFNDGNQSNLAGFNLFGPIASPPAPAVVPASGGTITPPAYASSMLVNPSAAVTGAVLAPGTQDGQQLTVLNQSANSITFAAAGASNVADGTGCVISAQRAMYFEWSATLALWLHT